MTSSPSPSGPVVPQAARANTPAGAEAFVRFYLGLVNEAWTTPKTGLLTAFSDPECQYCGKVDSGAEQLMESKTRYRSDPITVTGIREILSPPGQVIFEVDVRQNAAKIVDVSGEVVDTAISRRSTYTVGVQWHGGQWRFVDLERT